MNLDVLARTLSFRRALLRHERWTRERVRAYQHDQLQALLAYTYAHSPFYRRFHQDVMGRPLDQLPVLTKAMVMGHFDELVTDRRIRLADVQAHIAEVRGDERYLGRYWVNATSGSTGHPGLFLFDEAGWAAVVASAARIYEWGGVGFRPWRRQRIAIVASRAPWAMSARIGATLPSFWTPTLRLDAASPMAETVAALNAWAPEVVVAYASTTAALAQEQLVGRLRIAPRAVFASSEVLTPAMRATVEAAWGQRLFEAYAATEAGTLAGECEHHRGMHLMEDLAIVELVDARNRPVPTGEWADKVLVTSLFNQVQPLIRYEMSDMLRLTDAVCPCGRPFPLLGGIQGRQEDVLTFESVDGGLVSVHPNVFHQALELAPVAGWQIVQRPEGLRLLVESAPDPALGDRLQAVLRAALLARRVAVPPLEVAWVGALPRGRTGKAPLIRVEPG